MKQLFKIIAGIVLLAFAAFAVDSVTTALATTLKVVQTPKMSLYAGIGASATSMRVTPFPRDLDNIKLTYSDLGDNPTITIDPGIKNIEEIISFTSLVDNGDNTATFGGLTRNLPSKFPYTTGGTGRPHGASAVVVFSNNPQIYGRLAAKENDESITGRWNFSTILPFSSLSATATNQFLTLGQAAGMANAGAATATESITGISRLATALQQASSTASTSVTPLVLQAQYASSSPVVGCAVGYTTVVGAGCVPVAGLNGKISALWIELTSLTSTSTFNATTSLNGITYVNQYIDYRASTTISGVVPVFVATSTGWIQQSQANVATTSDFLGFAVRNTSAPLATTTVQISGVVSGFIGLATGTPYYVSDTRGSISSTVGTAELYVGRAVSPTQILLDRQDASWQFLGSQTCVGQNLTSSSCDTVSVPFARYAIAVSVFGGTNCSAGNSSSARQQIMVSKIGITSAEVTNASGCNSGTQNPLGLVDTVATFTSTSSVRIVQTSSPNPITGNTNTVYFYR